MRSTGGLFVNGVLCLFGFVSATALIGCAHAGVESTALTETWADRGVASSARGIEITDHFKAMYLDNVIADATHQGADDVPAKNNQRTIGLKDMECTVRTETQQGDPQAKPEDIVFARCTGRSLDGHRVHFVGNYAQELLQQLALSRAQIAGTIKNGVVQAKSVICYERGEMQQGDPTFPPEFLATDFRCRIVQ